MPRFPVPYRSTGRFAPIVADYIEGNEGLRELYVHTPDRSGLKAAMEDRRFDPGSRSILCAVLEDQYTGLEIDPAVRSNLELLRRSGTCTVTTGHQLCLFTGPLYVPFKILNIIRLARELSTADRPVVPVFWMASEDHDLAEVDHTWINGQRVHWAAPSGAGGPVGRMVLEDVTPTVEAAAALIGHGPFAEELRALMRSCYAPGSTLAQATRRFVNALFGRFGVVILDGDDARLKRLFAPVMQEELVNELTIRTVRYANEKLQQHYTPQAHARDINLFHLRPGHRGRIEREGDRFRVLDGGPLFTLEELLEELQRSPQDFSPNVLLRPVYQETILPNIAYVGGGGELAYWLQLCWLFQGLQVPMPALILRTSALFLSAKAARKWKALGLDHADLFTPRDALEKRVALERATFDTGLTAERAAHARLFEEIAVRARAIDPTLEASVRAKETFSAKGLDMIERKFQRAAERQQTDALRQVNAVLDAVFPGGLQERRENFTPWYAAEGPAFFDRLLDALDPLDPRFSVLEEDPLLAG